MRYLKKIMLFSLFLLQNLIFSESWINLFDHNGNFVLASNINSLLSNASHSTGYYKNTLDDLVEHIARSCPHLSTYSIEKVLLNNYLSVRNKYFIEYVRNFYKENQLTLESSLRTNEIKISGSLQKEQLGMKLQGIKDIFKMSGEGLFSLLGDKERMHT